MTAAHRRAASREREASRALHTQKVQRVRMGAAPDLFPCRLPCGIELTVEVKTRAKLPALLAHALEQAKRYRPGAVPLVVFSETGGRAHVVLPLATFARIAGLEPVKLTRQIPLALGGGQEP